MGASRIALYCNFQRDNKTSSWETPELRLAPRPHSVGGQRANRDPAPERRVRGEIVDAYGLGHVSFTRFLKKARG